MNWSARRPSREPRDAKLAFLSLGSLASRRDLHPALLLVAAVAAICFINLLREMTTADDGWVYARSVQLLLATGKYNLSACAVPAGERPPEGMKAEQLEE